MRACQCASRLAPRTALLGGVALWLLLLGSPANAGSCFPNDCYVQASVGDQNTPSLVALAELNVQAVNIPPTFVVGGTGATLVDASRSGDIFLDPPPGVVLISGSGHDYATPTQSCGVPGAPPCSASEPSSFLLLGSGVAGLAGVTCRRHRHK